MLAILTKKSKLKRKRKYLVILIQADPILPALEFPGEKGKRQVGQGRRDKAGQGRRQPKLMGTHHPPAPTPPSSPLQQPQELGTDVRFRFTAP